jgi:RimJ/RimL family protein N-acetyltransferase
MYGVIKADGHALASDSWSLDAGVLLENGSKVIAGGFFNLSKSPTSILIHLIFVEETYRKNGIYTKIHSLIDVVGTEQNRHKIYSYVHSKNKIMQEHIIKKIGYEPVMQLVSRKIKGN